MSEEVIKSSLKKTLDFYKAVGAPVTFARSYRALPKEVNISYSEFLSFIKKINYSEHFKKDNPRVYYEKMNKALKYARVFRRIPFVDFVIVAGSLALGNVNNHSDVDFIVGTKKNRVFTVRILSFLFFQLTGQRKKKKHGKQEASDKVCLNHFISPDAYKLSPPYNFYWIMLYRSLLPVLGNTGKIENFFEKNKWAGSKFHIEKEFFLGNEKGFPASFLEKVLRGKVGDFLESVFKKVQLKKIISGLENELGYKPRLKYNDDELELHPDTKRVEEILKKL